MRLFKQKLRKTVLNKSKTRFAIQCSYESTFTQLSIYVCIHLDKKKVSYYLCYKASNMSLLVSCKKNLVVTHSTYLSINKEPAAVTKNIA